MSNHNIMESTNNNSTMMNNNKPKRKSVQFGRVSYSDDSNEKELSQHHPPTETPYKFLERSAMCSSVPIPPPCPPQRKASAEVVLLDDEMDDFESASSSSISIAASLMASLVTSDPSEEEKETDDSDNSSRESVRYISPLITMRKTISPGGAPTRTRPRLGVSPSQLPPCFPARCL